MSKHKHYDCIVAWANGAKIEWLHNGYGRWLDDAQPQWHLGREYRIKPQQKPDVVRYSNVSTKLGIGWDYPSIAGCRKADENAFGIIKLTISGETGKLSVCVVERGEA